MAYSRKVGDTTYTFRKKGETRPATQTKKQMARQMLGSGLVAVAADELAPSGYQRRLNAAIDEQSVGNPTRRDNKVR